MENEINVLLLRAVTVTVCDEVFIFYVFSFHFLEWAAVNYCKGKIFSIKLIFLEQSDVYQMALPKFIATFGA